MYKQQITRSAIRTRLLIGIFLAMILIMGVATWISYRVALHEADEIFGARLATSARVLDSLLVKQIDTATINEPIVVQLPKELEDANNKEPSPKGHPYETKIAFQLWHEDGRLLVRSESAPNRRLSPNVEGFSNQSSDSHKWHVFTLYSAPIWIEVAEDAQLREEVASDLGSTLSSPLIIGTLLTLLAVNLIVVIALKPLQILADKIKNRQPDALEPIYLEKVPAELGPVLNALNQLFFGISAALARERRFTDAAAHELRTPLTALSIHAQNLVTATTPQQREKSLEHLLHGLNRTKQMADQMLTYSRISAHADGEAPCNVDIVHELQYLIHNQNFLAQARGLTISFECAVPSLILRAKKSLLIRLIQNLLENACRYSTENARVIAITFKPINNTAVLLIENDSQPIATENAAHMFEPYFRIPGSKGDGSGLGLAMVKEIADQHGWKIGFSQDAQTHRVGFELVLQLC